MTTTGLSLVSAVLMLVSVAITLHDQWKVRPVRRHLVRQAEVSLRHQAIESLLYGAACAYQAHQTMQRYWLRSGLPLLPAGVLWVAVGIVKRDLFDRALGAATIILALYGLAQWWQGRKLFTSDGRQNRV